MSSAAIYQLSCFSSVSRNLKSRLRARSYPSPPRPKVLIIRSCHDGATSLSGSEITSALSYDEDATKSQSGRSLKTNFDGEEPVTRKGESEPIKEPVVSQQKRAAKIHDFCLGIPYGGLVLCGGLFGFIFSRNLASLRTSLFFGGPILALSTLSLKVWGKGKSSLPFILGQAVLAGILIWRSIKNYSLTNKRFPLVFYAAISAAMLCFYSYVVLSGGNPPPKKKPAVAVQ